MSVTALSTRGTLYNYTIVHRSMPSVEVPFISAIIDLDGGGSVKTNLKGIAPSPDGIPFGMPVEIKFEELDWRDDEGNRYLSFHAVPAPEETIDEQ